MADRTAWRSCRGRQLVECVRQEARQDQEGRRPPVHDDFVRRDFRTSPRRLWLTDITEQPTGEGTLYLRAIRYVFSKKIVGYPIDTRMKSRLAVTALNNAVARRGFVGGRTPHSDRGSRFRSVDAG
ncbi:DDE-type integrase/transposase/recombinase [[Kitasatospora] papulosa]|uniref:DDE-type integrase/transposase/recombinase n=1 Tax=[Kitasatospora] papulosa TaxID=1464011 RepID=UPI0036CBAD5A